MFWGDKLALRAGKLPLCAHLSILLPQISILFTNISILCTQIIYCVQKMRVLDAQISNLSMYYDLFFFAHRNTFLCPKIINLKRHDLKYQVQGSVQNKEMKAAMHNLYLGNCRFLTVALLPH